MASNFIEAQKISELPETTTLSADDLFPVKIEGGTRKITWNNIFGTIIDSTLVLFLTESDIEDLNTKTVNLELNIYNDTTKTYRKLLDQNFKIIDSVFNDVVTAVVAVDNVTLERVGGMIQVKSLGIQGENIADDEVGLQQLSPTVIALLNGTGLAKDADDETLEYIVEGVDTVVKLHRDYKAKIDKQIYAIDFVSTAKRANAPSGLTPSECTAAINNANDSAKVNGEMFVLNAGSWSLNADVTIDSNVTIKGLGIGTKIFVASGYTLTIKGSFENVVFDTTGTVDFSESTKITEVTPQMFLAKGNGVANDRTPIQKAINSIGKGTVNFGNADYFVSAGTINLKSNVNLKGNSAIVRNTTRFLNVFTAENVSDIDIDGLTIIGGSSIEGDGRLLGNGILSDNTKNLTIKNCKIYDVQNGVMDDNSNFLTIEKNYFQNRQAGAFTSLHLRGTANSKVMFNDFIDSLHTSSASTTNAIYWYNAEQLAVNNEIGSNYTLGFGMNNPGDGYETFILVGGQWNVHDNTMLYGWRTIDIASYPSENSRVGNSILSTNTIKYAKEWAIKAEKNLSGVQSQEYLIVNENIIDSCAAGILFYENTKNAIATKNIITRTYGAPSSSSGALVAIGASNCKFVGNIIDSSQTRGAKIQESSFIDFIANSITNSGLFGNEDYGNGVTFDGVSGYNSKYNRILSNYIANSLGYGLQVRYCEAPIIMENHTIQNETPDTTVSKYAGIGVEQSRMPIISYNVSKKQSYGLRISTLVSPIVQFNQLDSNTVADFSSVGITNFGEVNAGTDSVIGGQAKFAGLNLTDYLSLGSNPSTAGTLRMHYGASIYSRNSNNTADLIWMSMNIFTGGNWLDIGHSSNISGLKLFGGGNNPMTLNPDGSVNFQGNIKRFDVQVLSSQQAAVPDATGGSVIDVEARAAINDFLAKARVHGLIAP